MKARDFDPTTYRTSGSFCSEPCGIQCPTQTLIEPVAIQTAMAVDEVLTTREPADIRSADTQQLSDWSGEALSVATEGSFDGEAYVQLGVVYAAVYRISRGGCPNYQV